MASIRLPIVTTALAVIYNQKSLFIDNTVGAYRHGVY